jgi:predicted ATPase
MKIDIHVHTKKIKAGDSEHRNIVTERFSEIIKATDVKILAITNHNHFDHEQYLQFKKSVDGFCQVWPGVELDIIGKNGTRAHLIVIVNPKNAKTFEKKINTLMGKVSADSFTVDIAETVKCFDDLDSIYIAHYHSKKPNLIDEDVEDLLNLVSNSKRILKEATNSISAGIYINHGHNSIHGSDVHNWDDYHNISQELPELRLPVESFEQFCLLLERDEATITTILDKKTKESIQLNPFGIAETIDLDIYNDINILFGSKGTGKTEILKALSKYYNEKGFKTDVYESNSMNLEEIYDLKGTSFSVSVEELGIDECKLEISSIKNATEKSVTSLSTYLRYFSTEEKNRISKNLKIKDFAQLDAKSAKRNFEQVEKALSEFKNFNDSINTTSLIEDIAGKKLYLELNNVVKKILEKIKAEYENRFIDYKSIALFNSFIKKFINEIAKKTGQPEKPISTGFAEYASNRINIEKSIKKIIKNISMKIPPLIEDVGDLGKKGRLFCQTNLVIQNGTFTDSKYNPLQKVNKTPQKQVATNFELISKNIYTNQLFKKIADLKATEGSETIKTTSDLMLFNRHFTLNDQKYKPSNGESSMVLLHKELLNDKPIYIIDEPEKSLGNDYISEVIVPLIKERAKIGKKIIIATHDANIAVRTLPYNSIYREHDFDYHTYTGNPFSNNLNCTSKSRASLDWKMISMKTLEGGKEAFGERGKIYGKI